MNAKLLLDSTIKDLKNYSGKWTWFIVGEYTLHFFVRLPNQYRGEKKLDFLHNSTDFDCIYDIWENNVIRNGIQVTHLA